MLPSVQRLGAAKPDAIDHLALVAQLQLQVFFAHQALRDNFHVLAERGRLKALAPDLQIELFDHGRLAKLGRQCAIGVQATGEHVGTEQLLRHLGKGAAKALEMFHADGATSGHGVAAKAQQHIGVAFGEQIQRIAQMKTGDRAARALELMRLALGLAGGKHKGGAVQPVFDARGDDADHAFVKFGVKHADGRRGAAAVLAQPLGQGKGLLAHIALQVLALAVDAVQRLGQFQRLAKVVGQQAFDADGHVRQAPRRIDARPQGKAKILRAGLLPSFARRLVQRPHPGGHVAFANAQQPLIDQAAVVRVQPHHVGHRAQGHQGQQGIELGLGRGGVGPAFAQQRPQLQQHIKHHAHPRQAFAGKAAAGLVGIDHGLGRGQLGTGQVVVGHQHLQAQALRLAHPGDAADAVVHGDQQAVALGGHAPGDGGREAVAVLHPVGHFVADVLRPQHAQTAHGHSAGGGTVAVVIGHDADALLRGNGLGQQLGGGLNALEATGRQQVLQAGVQLLRRLHAPPDKQSRQQRRNAVLHQRIDLGLGNFPFNDFHSWLRRELNVFGLKKL